MESALQREDPGFSAAMSAGLGHRRISTAAAGFGVVIVLVACFGPPVAAARR